MKETSLGVWHGPCSRGSSKHGPMPHENKSRTGTPGRARQGPRPGQAACMMCVCTFRAVWGAHRCPACSPVACRPAALPPRQVDATLPDPPSEARRHRDPIRAETRERLSSCGCEELGRTILDEFQTIGRHVGRPLTGFMRMRTAPRSDSLSNQIESSRVASKFSNILLGCTAAHCTGRGQTSGVSAFPHPSLSLSKR